MSLFVTSHKRWERHEVLAWFQRWLNDIGCDIRDDREEEVELADLGLDSLDEMELIMEAEDHFDVEISDEDAERVSTLQAAVDLVMRLL